MTRGKILWIFLMLCLNAGLYSADVEVLNKFDLNPRLKLASIGKNDKQKTITARLKLKECKNKDFLAECDLQIRAFNHYAPLSIGFDDKKAKFSVAIHFSCGDDAVRRAEFIVKQANGKTLKSKTLDHVKKGKYRLRFLYSAADKALTLQFSDKNKKNLIDYKVPEVANFAIDSFFIRANRTNDIGTIWYDPEAKNIFIRSFVGMEGGYKYMIETSVDNLFLKY